ncbi:ABC transporter permease [Emticicia sp. C21]|uniref:ABC transporter permease n=1 Tax=Emticicia sp. C21 TaxID=2302915 RepID=UPI000E355484|nr:ABC transporter permease [Emticicia sp. C21]RFS16790.1 hypothetical protein D0T08_08910 [Emticicia sp. C21]
MNLAITFRSELLKTKRTSAFYLTVFGASFITLMELLEMLTTSDSVARLYPDPWQIYFRISLQMMIGMILPLYMILICTLLAQIEFRNNTWKQVFGSPQSEVAVFISKFLNLQFLIFSFILLNVIFLFLGAFLLNSIDPKLDLFHKYLDWQHLLTLLSKTFVCSLAISSIQFWMSLRFRNFILPLAIGFVLWFAGIMMTFEYKTISKEWYPYSYLMMIAFPGFEDKHSTLILNALILTFGFLIGGFWDFKRRKGKG